jgi:hypothetical protein
VNIVAELPMVRMLVELTASGVPVPGVRVDRVRDTELVLSLPDGTDPDTRPRIGDRVILRWPAGSRGRYAVTATVVPPPDDHRVGVSVQDVPELEQQREYVRGGGGERIRLLQHHDEGTAVFAGWVQDLSERGARAHFSDVRVRVGDTVWGQIELDTETVDVMGTVLRLELLPDNVGAYLMRVEVVVVFDVAEQQARTIRRYVFRQQLLARARDDD